MNKRRKKMRRTGRRTVEKGGEPQRTSIWWQVDQWAPLHKDRKPHVITQIQARKLQCGKCLCSVTLWKWGNWNWICLYNLWGPDRLDTGGEKDSFMGRIHQRKGGLSVARRGCRCHLQWGDWGNDFLSSELQLPDLWKEFRKKSNNPYSLNCT